MECDCPILHYLPALHRQWVVVILTSNLVAIVSSVFAPLPSLPAVSGPGHPHRTHIFKIIPQASVSHVTAQGKGLDF